MNRTQLFLLVAVLGLASFYAWSKVHKIESTEQEYQEARYFTELEEEDVGRIRVVASDPEFQYELVQKGDAWFIDSHLLSVEKSHQLVSSILELSREREMDPAPTPEREAEFKLDKPKYRLTVWNKEGEELGTVKLGARTPDYNHFYGQWEKGGPISTVPAYTLGTLEEEPKDLREDSLFPVEVASVESFRIEKDGSTLVSLEKDGEEDFVFKVPEQGRADETQVEKFLFQLKDIKVGRFLSDEEEPPTGEITVKYVADLGYSEFDQVTELKQRVAVNPDLVYGRRYFLESGTGEPAEGTVERFVVEVSSGSEVTEPTVRMFEDRRVLEFDMDNVRQITVERDGHTFKAKKDPVGKWKVEGDEQAAGEAAGGLLFTLKDLRFVEPMEEAGEPAANALTIRLERKSGPQAVVRFAGPENGKPYLWRESKGYSLSDSSWDALSDSVAKLFTNASNE